MKFLDVLWCMALPLAMSATNPDPLVADLRALLEDICGEANGKWSQAYEVPDTQEELVKDGAGWVSLSLGYLDNLQNMSREGDCSVEIIGDTARASANIYIDSLEYSYDFSTRSKTFSDATGCVFGKLDLVRAQLSIELDLRNTSAVTATVQAVTFKNYGVLVTDEASINNLNEDFTEYLSFALMNLMDKKTLSFLGHQVENFINNTLTNVTFDMRSTSFVTNTPGQSSTTSSNTLSTTTAKPHTNTAKHTFTTKVTSNTRPSTSNPVPTTHHSTSNATTTAHQSSSYATTTTHNSTSDATNTTHHSTSKVPRTILPLPIEATITSHTLPNLSPRVVADSTHIRYSNNISQSTQIIDNDDVFGFQTPKKGTINVVLLPRKVNNSGTKYDDKMGISCRLTSMSEGSENRDSKKITILNAEVLAKVRKFNRSGNKMRNQFSNAAPAVKDSLTIDFNNFFDTLFNKTDMQFVSQKIEPYKLPGGEEELYEYTDGSVKLVDGSVYGMETMTLSLDPTMKIRNATAVVSVGVYFSNITYSFNFSTDSRTFSSVSGRVHGNVTRLNGMLSIIANLTEVTAVTATLKSFQLLPTVEFSTDVEYSANVSGKVSEEVSDAVISDFNDNLIQRLQDWATEVLQVAAARIRKDMSSPSTSNATTTAGPTSQSTGSNSPGITLSAIACITHLLIVHFL